MFCVRGLAAVVLATLALIAPSGVSAALPHGRLSEAIARGELTRAQAMREQLFQIFSIDRADPRWIDRQPDLPHCGTPVLTEIAAHLDELDPETRASYEHLVMRAGREPGTFATHTLQTEHFLIEYEDSGPNAVPMTDTNPVNGTPDFIERVALACEQAWSMEVETLGYDAPERYVGSGGQRYPVSFQFMTEGTLGYTSPQGGDRTRFVLHSTFEGFANVTDDPDGNAMGLMRSTVAHELKHAIQYMYRHWDEASVGWYELDAVWVEDLVFDQVNFYVRRQTEAQSPLMTPWASLDATPSYEDNLWERFLSERMGNAHVRSYWQTRRDNPLLTFPATYAANVLNSGNSFAVLFGEYAAWNAATGSRSGSGFGYEERTTFPEAAVSAEFFSLPVATTIGQVDRLASRIYLIHPGSSSGRPRIRFASGASVNWQVSVVYRQSNGTVGRALMSLPQGAGEIVLGSVDWSQLEYATVVVANPSLSVDGAAFEFDVGTLPSSGGTGNGTSEPFALYLGAGYRAPSPSLSGASQSDPFVLRTYLGSIGVPGFAFASSSDFPLYLGSGFRAPSNGGFGSHSAGAIALWTGRFREGFAVSNGRDIDTRPPDPTPVAGPEFLAASPDFCTGGVLLSWLDRAADEDGFYLDRKVAGLADIFYDRVRTLSPNAQHFVDRPPFGGVWAYRVRAFRGLAISSPSNEATSGAGKAPGPLAYSAGVSVKSLGDRQRLRIRVKPPVGTQSWMGIRKVRVEIGTSPGFATPISTLRPDPPVFGEMIAGDFSGSPNTDYWMRVVFERDCGTESPALAGTIGPHRPKTAPVLLVHGIWGETSQWDGWKTALESAGVPSCQLMEFICPDDRWTQWSSELDTRIRYEFIAGAWRDHEYCDIVAHSQGGLAARGYIEGRWKGWRQVRTLFMLGTPNHGGNVARIRSWIGRGLTNACPFEGRGNGVYALRADGKELTILNYDNETLVSDERSCRRDSEYDQLPLELAEDRRQTTRYYAIAGTASDEDCDERHRLRCVHWRATDDPCSGDGIVAWQSVRLRSVLASGSCTQWLDSDFDGTSYETRRLSHSDGTVLYTGWGGETYFSSAGVRRFVIDVLLDQVSNGPTRCMRDWVDSAPALVRRLDEPAGTPVLIAAHDDVAPAGGKREHTLPVDTCSRLLIVADWHDGAGTLQLRSPSGVLYSEADTAGNADLHFEADGEAGYAAMAIDRPQAGTWTLLVEAVGTQPVQYTESWVVVDGSRNLSVAARPDPVEGVVSILVTASMRSASGPVAARMEAFVDDPDGESIVVPLRDDGNDGDATAEDRLYTGRFFPADRDGEYLARVKADELPVVAGSATRIAEAPFTVTHRPLLRVDGSDLSAAPPAPFAGSLSEIRAMLHNDGSANADSVIVRVETQTGDSLGSMAVSIPAGDSIQFTTLWTPSEAGSNGIRLLLLPTQPLDEASRTVAEFAVPVLAEVPSTTDAPAEFPLPVLLEFATPWPNPSRSGFTMRWALPAAARVRLEIFDVLGRRVALIADGYFTPGRYVRSWDGRGSSAVRMESGVYFASLEAAGQRLTRRIVLLE